MKQPFITVHWYMNSEDQNDNGVAGATMTPWARWKVLTTLFTTKNATYPYLYRFSYNDLDGNPVNYNCRFQNLTMSWVGGDNAKYLVGTLDLIQEDIATPVVPAVNYPVV